MAMLRVAVERPPGLLQKPLPFVFQQSLGDFAVIYELEGAVSGDVLSFTRKACLCNGSVNLL